jgi:hypothetical protein
MAPPPDPTLLTSPVMHPAVGLRSETSSPNAADLIRASRNLSPLCYRMTSRVKRRAGAARDRCGQPVPCRHPFVTFNRRKKKEFKRHCSSPSAAVNGGFRVERPQGNGSNRPPRNACSHARSRKGSAVRAARICRPSRARQLISLAPTRRCANRGRSPVPVGREGRTRPASHQPSPTAAGYGPVGCAGVR